MDFIHELYQIKTLILTEVAPHFLYLGRGVGSIMCAIMVAVISCSIFLQDGIDWGLVARPLCVMFIISVFPQLIVTPLDAISQGLNGWMDTACEQTIEQREQLSEQLKRKIEQEEIIEYSIEDTDIAEMDGLYESTEESRTELPNRFQRWIMDAMVYLVEIFSYVAQMFVSFLSVIYMIILSITGPLTFALAIVPMFRSGIGSWFARYIQIMLWMPISHIIVIIMNLFHIVILRSALENSVAVTWPTTIMVCLSLVMTIALFKIPTLCEWIVESTGGTAFNAAVNKAGSKVVSAGMTVVNKVVSK